MTKEPIASRPSPDWLGGKDFLSWSWAVEQLTAERNYWIVSTRTDGFPQARPVWGAWDGDRLYLSVGHGGLQRAKKRSDGAFDITIHVDSAVNVVIVEGIAARSGRTPKRVVEAYNEKYEWDATPALLNFVMQPSVVFGWKDEDVKTATRWTFA